MINFESKFKRMQASDLYKGILGIDLPWFTSDIEINDATHHVTVKCDYLIEPYSL